MVAIKPKPAIKPLFDLVTTKTRSGVVLVRDGDKASSDDDDATDNDECSRWRRRRVDLLHEHGLEVLLAA